MKALFIALLLIASNSFALSNKEVVDLFKENNLKQVELANYPIENSKLNSIVYNLNKTSLSLSSIWYDTILEGDYEMFSSPRLDKDSIFVLVHKNELVGFAASVSAPAAYSGECLQDESIAKGQPDIKYKACLSNFKGNISERFLSDINGNYIESYREEPEFMSEI